MGAPAAHTAWEWRENDAESRPMAAHKHQGRRQREVDAGSRGASEAPRWPTETTRSTSVVVSTTPIGSEVVVLPIGLPIGCGMQQA